MPISRGMLLAAALTVATVGCERGYFQEPAPGQSAPVALSLTFGSAAGGPGAAFDHADRIWIHVRAGSTTRFEQIFPIDANGADLQLPFEVRLAAVRESVTIEVELRLGDAPVFRGTAPLVLRIGRTTGASVALEPVASGLALPDVPALESYGDSVRLEAALVFATGDTIEVSPVSWTSLDPGVIAIEGGVPVAKTDGDARLVARLGELTDTIQVRVFAVVRTIVVDPPITSLGLGQSQQYTALLYDARGNRIVTSRPITWTSSDTLVIRIADDGTAMGVSVGSARISAKSGNASNDVLVQAQPGAPHATTEQPDQIITSTARLHGTVLSGGMTTQVWFQWTTEPSFTTPFTTPEQTVGGGTSPNAIQAQLTGLQPNTTYFYRLIAQNGAGTSIGEPLTFSTRAGTPIVNTGNATNVTQASATLNGSVVSNGTGTAWFEYGTSSNLATFTTTAAQTLGAGTAAIGISAGIAGLQPSTNYWFRLVVKTTAGTLTGQVLSFTTLAPPPGAPAAMTDSSNSVTQTAASLFGRATPNGAASQVRFEYGTDPLLVGAASTALQAIGAGNTPVAATANITGLTPGTTYYFRTVASSSVATVPGGILSFTTVAPPQSAPAATTQAATSLGVDAATANALVDPKGGATTAWFEYGTDPALAAFTATTAQNIGSGNGNTAVQQLIGSLTAATTYYVRAVASNSGGTTHGTIVSFTTLPTPPLAPTVTTDPAGSISATGATLFATVNPNGSTTQVVFEYGTSATLTGATTTAAQNIGAGTTAVAPSVAVAGLAGNTQYYFRAVATNAGGTVSGAILSFTTAAATLAPLAFTDAATDLGPDSALVNGRVNPRGSTTLAWFEWSDDATFATFVSNPAQNVGAGNAEVGITDLLPSLDENTTYYFRIAASNAGGTVRGTVVSLTTFASGPIEHAAVTLAATAVSAGMGTINGTATANQSGFPTEWWFEYSLDPGLANPGTTARIVMGPDLTPQSVAVPLTGLQPDLQLYFRLVVSSVGGRVYGAILNFKPE